MTKAQKPGCNIAVTEGGTINGRPSCKDVADQQMKRYAKHRAQEAAYKATLESRASAPQAVLQAHA